MQANGCLMRVITALLLAVALVASLCTAVFPAEQKAVRPGLYLNQQELEVLKSRLDDQTVSVYGFTWKSQYDSLIHTADTYLTEQRVEQGFNAGTSVVFELQPVLIDPNDDFYDSRYLAASIIDGKLVENPHLGFGCLIPDTLRVRMETLSLAYALTGDTRYADLAISYAVQMCGWEFWGDWDWLDTYTNHKMKADASNAWATQGVAAVYDLCYDRLTAQQKTTIQNGIINKGLEPMYKQVNGSTTNSNMMLVGGMLTGIAAIVGDTGSARVQKYIDKALVCVNTAFDEYAYSGNTEGHYYTGYGLDYFLPGVLHYYRATGLQSLVKHPLLSEILPYWTVMFAAPATMSHPNYSDGGVGVQLKLPMAVVGKLTGDPLATYFLTQTKGLNSPFQNLVYLNPDPDVKAPTDHVAVVDSIGYGALRTGFAQQDMLLTMLSNSSKMGHNHYDQNSIQFNVGGSWIISDPGAGSYYYADRSFWEKGGHSTILVDGAAQSVMGTGSMELVFDSGLYGYILGSAPEAYGNAVSRFDRHAIQINHSQKAYYIVIDDLNSAQRHQYSWQMFNGDRVGFSVDGTPVPEMTAVKGNNVSMMLGAHKLNVSFVSNQKLTIADKIYEANGNAAGYTLTATGASAKAYQFMTLISTEEVCGRSYCNFASDWAGESLETNHQVKGEISWRSSDSSRKTIVKSNSVGTLSSVFFRGGGAGDYIKIPFRVEASGTYNATLLMGVSDGCCRIKATINGVESAVVDCSGLPETSRNIEFQNLKLEAGVHEVTIQVVGKGQSKDYIDGYYLINAGGLILDDVNASAEGKSTAVTVAETYDTAGVLGALINYADDLQDLVMFNRASGTAIAGKLSCNGKQAAVLGLQNGKITEGFAATAATSLRYGTSELFHATRAVDIVADQEGWHIRSSYDQTVKLGVQQDGTYKITVNGRQMTVESVNGMISVTLEKGETNVQVLSMNPAPIEPTQPTEPDSTEPDSTEPDPTEPDSTEPTESVATEPTESTEPASTESSVPAESRPVETTPTYTEPAVPVPEKDNGAAVWKMAAMVAVVGAVLAVVVMVVTLGKDKK